MMYQKPLSIQYVESDELHPIHRVDIHNCCSVFEAIQQAVRMDGPAVVLARTVKGKGVSFMEGVKEYHGRALTGAEMSCAMEELDNGV